MLLQLKTDAEKKIVNEVVNNTVITKDNFWYQIWLLSEATLGGIFKLKSVKKSVEVVRFFHQSGRHSDLVQETVLSRNIFVFIFEDTDELENKDWWKKETKHSSVLLQRLVSFFLYQSLRYSKL